MSGIEIIEKFKEDYGEDFILASALNGVMNTNPHVADIISMGAVFGALDEETFQKYGSITAEFTELLPKDENLSLEHVLGDRDIMETVSDGIHSLFPSIVEKGTDPDEALTLINKNILDKLAGMGNN